MTVGSILLIHDADAAQQPLLGAPVVLRALAATLLPREDVAVVAVAPASLHATLRQEADRFGFTELAAVLPSTGREVDDVAAALRALPPADHVLVQDGLHALCPVALAVRVVEAARASGAAAGVVPVHGAVFEDGATLGRHVAGRLVQARLPAAFRRDLLEKACAGGGAEGLLAAAAEAGVALARVEGDADQFPVDGPAALNRALEAWGRRAVEYAFIWPRAGEPAATVVPPIGNELNLTIPEQPADSL